MKKRCPRCGSEFDCRSGEPGACQCEGVRLGPHQRAHIAGRYPDCLCRRCLEQTARTVPDNQEDSQPSKA